MTDRPYFNNHEVLLGTCYSHGLITLLPIWLQMGLLHKNRMKQPSNLPPPLVFAEDPPFISASIHPGEMPQKTSADYTFVYWHDMKTDHLGFSWQMLAGSILTVLLIGT